VNPEIIQFWQNAQLVHINPGLSDELPEGWDIKNELAAIFQNRTVSDIGCGYGRLCSAFDPARYTGFDINPSAIAAAKHRNPGYRFTHMRTPSDYEVTDAALLYTVLLHVHDDDIEPFIAQLCLRSKRIVAAEIMLKAWRGDTLTRPPGAPPVFNRDAKVYIEMFEKNGFAVDDIIVGPYKRYPDTVLTLLVMDRIK
jgi:SAM-dependent methyltransferase